MKTIICICTAINLLVVHAVISQTACGPCRCHDDRSYRGGITAVCSGLKLTRVPRELPPNTTTLLMDKNNFTQLPPRVFAGVKKLKHLDLSDNKFKGLGGHVFNGLSHLGKLILDGNMFMYNCTPFNPVFLKPLMSLHTLSVLDQKDTCPHMTRKTPLLPYSATSYPGGLQNLYIDCFYCEFQSSFQRLQKLSLLSLTSDRRGLKCAMYEMDNNTFRYMPYLKTLNISDCQVSFVKPGIFQPLRNLRKLDMSMYIVEGDEFDAFTEASKSLQSSQIEYVKFVSFRSIQTNADLFTHLQNTKLKELYMVGTLYPLIDTNTLEKLPRSLEVLTLRHFQYSSKSILVELQRHPTIKTLDLSEMILSQASDTSYYHSIFTISPVVKTYICSRCHCFGFLGFPMPSVAPVPYIGKGIAQVKKLTLPDNGISYFEAYAYDKMKYVEDIDLQRNRLENLPILSPNNSIFYLNVAGNRLGNFLASDNTSALGSLSKLQIVDFTDNNVFSLSTNGLNQLHSVRIINLSNNYLETVNIRLIHLTNLEVLDLRNNKIHAIGEDTRRDLSRLHKARLHLDGNPLICGCDELDSLQWMKQNRKRVQNLTSLNCRLSTGKRESLRNLDEIITNLQTLCKSDIVEISVSVSVTVSILSLVAGVLIYRHRWKLRYLYYAGRRGYRRRHNKEYIHLEDYQYDAFISYADPDRRLVFDEMMKELEEKHGLKLCVHHRDFLPGEVISDNIVNAIQNSRKTVVVLSPSFLKSDWCEFEFNMARMEGVTRRQDIVLMLLYEDVSMMNLSKDMATMLKRNCYLEYNHELYNKEIFWYNVKESIQTIRQRD